MLLLFGSELTMGARELINVSWLQVLLCGCLASSRRSGTSQRTVPSTADLTPSFFTCGLLAGDLIYCSNLICFLSTENLRLSRSTPVVDHDQAKLVS